jgi:hypothetical protein
VGPSGPTVFTDTSGNFQLAYHAWTGGPGYQNGGVRSLWIDEVSFGGGRLFLGGPPACQLFSSSTTGTHQVCGDILEKYQDLGGPSSFLGYPTTDETGTPDGVGRFNHFANNGSIYWTPSTGAWSVHGAIQTEWAEMGWERSCLGYPISDEYTVQVSDKYGVRGDRRSNFQRGTITFSLATKLARAHCT